MIKLTVHPLDTVFFRDGKPFSMGEDTWADGVFPPYPSVIYGALRTWYIARHASAYTNDAIEESGRIKLESIQYRLPKGLHLPMPLDLVSPKHKSEPEKNKEVRDKVYRMIKLGLRPEGSEDVMSSHALPQLLMPPQGIEVESLDDGLMSNEGDFERYLQGALAEVEVRRIKDFAITEPKVGIGRDDATNAASDSMLYRVGMRRSSDFRIVISANLPNEDSATEHSLIKLGAEGKFAEVNVEPVRRQRPAVPTVAINKGGFKLYLSTPAIFKQGWKPDLASKGISAELIAAAIGKPVHIGGFDMKKRQPKPMYKAVPAGSVYYYKSSEDPHKIIDRLHDSSISDFQMEQGFGIAYIGNY